MPSPKCNFFVMIKPDGVKRGLVGEIISRFERRGFTLQKIRMGTPSQQLVSEHYAEHGTRDFFTELIYFTTSGDVVPMVWYGNIETARAIVGATNPAEAMIGTIRGDCASCMPENLIHCSDSEESAAREVALWFPEQ